MYNIFMRKAARAIIIKDGKMLVMFRNKFGSKYVTLLGGAVEIGEKPEDCVVREVAEEASVVVSSPRLVFIDHAGFFGDQYVYLCNYVSGEPALSEASHEFQINKIGKNLYEPGWLPLTQLPEVSFLSAELQKALILAINKGWPEQVQEFTSTRNVK